MLQLLMNVAMWHSVAIEELGFVTQRLLVQISGGATGVATLRKEFDLRCLLNILLYKWI